MGAVLTDGFYDVSWPEADWLFSAAQTGKQPFSAAETFLVQEKLGGMLGDLGRFPLSIPQRYAPSSAAKAQVDGEHADEIVLNLSLEVR